MAPTCPRILIKAKVQFESFPDFGTRRRDVRSTPTNGNRAARTPCPKSANRRHRLAYSITSAAWASGDGGTINPSALRGFGLIASWDCAGPVAGGAAGY